MGQARGYLRTGCLFLLLAFVFLVSAVRPHSSVLVRLCDFEAFIHRKIKNNSQLPTDDFSNYHTLICCTFHLWQAVVPAFYALSVPTEIAF